MWVCERSSEFDAVDVDATNLKREHKTWMDLVFTRMAIKSPQADRQSIQEDRNRLHVVNPLNGEQESLNCAETITKEIIHVCATKIQGFLLKS